MTTKTKLIQRVVATSGNVHDGKVSPQLLCGKELAVWGDAAYSGQGPVIQEHAPWAHGFTQHRGRAYKYLSQMHREVSRKRSEVRARAEHTIGVIKRVFGFAKVRYRGLAKNGNRPFVTAALANLYIVRSPLPQLAKA